jgi:enoyl-CoA hydratase
MNPDLDAPALVRREGAVAVVTLNRPDKRNALDLSMRAAIATAFTELDSADAVRCIVVTGSNAVFAAGADLNLLVGKGAQHRSRALLGARRRQPQAGDRRCKRIRTRRGL